MKPLNPIFENKARNVTAASSITNVRKKPLTKEEGRKTRCDKKKDVKIPFSPEERRIIKAIAKRENLDPTPYCSKLIMKALKNNYDFPEVNYNPKGKPYPAKLESYHYDLLFEYKIKWDCSLKEAAYRIINFMMKLESGD